MRSVESTRSLTLPVPYRIFMTSFWNNRTAFVTGASQGIGAEIAVALARDGFDVAVSSTRIEKLSDITDWTDRSTCVLLGDGAGAAVLSADDHQHVGPVVWGSDPSLGNAVRILDDWHPTFAQDGQTVFRWATTTLAPIARQACERAGVAPKDLGAIVTHQANLRIIEAVVAKLDVPGVLVAQDVVESGNTSAASIPIALAKLVARGEVQSGARVLLLGFGGGLSWAGQVVSCP